MTFVVNDASVVPRASKPRQLLALLLLSAPHSVSAEALIEELWGEHPPASSVTTTQTYIMQLRRLLAKALKAGPEGEGKDSKSVLATRNGGYALEIPPETLDANRFRTLVRQGLRALEAGDPARAAGLQAEAGRLWGVGALVDVPRGARLEREAVRLDADADASRTCRIEAGLRLGRHWELLGELEALVAANVLDEGLCAQYMFAAYRCGKAHRGLQAYGRLRRHLVEELGIEPGPACREMQRQILASESDVVPVLSPGSDLARRVTA